MAYFRNSTINLLNLPSVVLVPAALPILWTPNVEIRSEVQDALVASLSGVLLFAADAWFQAGFVFLWQIALLVSRPIGTSTRFLRMPWSPQPVQAGPTHAKVRR